jgi:hypothetical protein
MLRFFLAITLASIITPSVALSGDDCRICHSRKGTSGFVDTISLEKSVHAGLSCSNCHISISPYPHGRVAPVNCGICHFLGKDGAPTEQAREFKLSVHGQALVAGNEATPRCQTCHGSHAIYPSVDERSKTHRTKIPALCSKCHPRQIEEYATSVHNRELIERNNPNAPTCFDCHQEHLTPLTGDKAWMLSLVQECGNCHHEQMRTYRKTYHGKVTQLGYVTMAKCSDCHGSHNILRVADPESTLSQLHILTTCRKCHPSATMGFTRFYAHADEANREKYPLLFYSYVFMTALLLGTLSFFFIHTALWAFRALKERKGGE